MQNRLINPFNTTTFKACDVGIAVGVKSIPILRHAALVVPRSHLKHRRLISIHFVNERVVLELVLLLNVVLGSAFEHFVLLVIKLVFSILKPVFDQALLVDRHPCNSFSELCHGVDLLLEYSSLTLTNGFSHHIGSGFHALSELDWSRSGICT